MTSGRSDARHAPRGIALLGRFARYLAAWRRFRDATMVPCQSYIANLYLADRCLARVGTGAVVECGTWRGGMAGGLAAVGGAARDYHFFDSFAGLPPAGPEDGAYARRAQETRSAALYFDNNTASLDEFMAVIARACLPRERLHVHQGLFADTLPRAAVGAVAVLRLDGDWYASTLQCLEQFWDAVLPGGLILIDDYYAWEGCTKAVHAFLAKRGAREPVRQSRFGKVAYIMKRSAAG
jgi:O-methyltransferase